MDHWPSSDIPPYQANYPGAVLPNPLKSGKKWLHDEELAICGDGDGAMLIRAKDLASETVVAIQDAWMGKSEPVVPSR